MIKRIVFLLVILMTLSSCSAVYPYWYCLGLCDPAAYGKAESNF